MLRRWIIIICVISLSLPGFSQERRLDYYIQQGLANSPLLKDLINQVRSNSQDSLLVKANHIPQINFNGTMSYAPVVNDYGYSTVITNGGNLITVVNISQPLFNKKTTLAQYSKVGLLNQSVMNSARISEKDLKKAITAQYLTASSVLGDIAFENILLIQSEEEGNILEKLVRNGLYKQTEYLSFLVETQSLELQMNDLQIQYRRELMNLNLLCGIGDTNFYELQMPDISLENSTGQTGSPFFRRFTIDSLRISTDLLLTDRNYKPRFSWYTDAGLVNNDPAVIYKNLGVSFGLSLTVPVYDGNQRKLNHEKLKASELTRQGYRDFFRIQYNQQYRQLNDELIRTRDLVPRIQKQLEMAGSIIRQDKQLLMNDIGISITDYIIALKNYIAIQTNLNHYKVRVLQVINELNYWKE